MNRTAVLAVGAAAAVAIIAAGAGYAYFFSGLRTAPKPLALSSPAPATSAATSASPSGLIGKWSVASGSQAGFRANEVFAGQGAHVADVRTSQLSGGLTIAGDAAGSYQVTGVAITAGLSGLKSQDQVAGRDVSQRDFSVQQQLAVRQFPEATFRADSVSVPDTVGAQPSALNVPGTLTIHGVGRQVTVAAQAQINGGRLEVAGRIPVTITDYGVQPPQMGFVTVSPQLTVEFDVFLTRGA